MIDPLASILGVGSFEITTFIALETAGKSTRESQDTPAINPASKRLFGMTNDCKCNLLGAGFVFLCLKSQS
jgi:hypothetical protein